MAQPAAQFVPCLHCTKGPKGAATCSSGYSVRTLKGGGCFMGAFLPGKEPASRPTIKPAS